MAGPDNQRERPPASYNMNQYEENEWNFSCFMLSSY